MSRGWATGVALGLAWAWLGCGGDGASDTASDLGDTHESDTSDLGDTHVSDTSGAGDLEDAIDPGAGRSAAVLCARKAGLCALEADAAPTLGAPVKVAPSAAMPAEVVSQVAHNNLDVAWHDDGEGGRLFFAFRTGPNHFAAPEVVMYVVSTADLTTWRFEGSFALGTDVREPQLVSLGGRLLFYFVELGADAFDFEPHGVKVSEWLGPGRFGAVRDIFEPGFLVWRIKTMARPGETLGEWAYAFGYAGGENIYDNDGEPIRVAWLRSRDGLAWEPVVAGQEHVLVGGASETDAVFLDDGTVVAVARNEAGDESGFGSKICRGEAASPATWTCVGDPRKYDSPMVFRRGADVWLLGRRNVTETGNYDLGQDTLPLSEQYLAYQMDYWIQPKRCALWKIDPVALSATWVLDLPSAGDTCFPEAVDLGGDRQLVFNYSSPLGQDPEPNWLTGQMNETQIDWMVLALPSP